MGQSPLFKKVRTMGQSLHDVTQTGIVNYGAMRGTGPWSTMGPSPDTPPDAPLVVLPTKLSDCPADMTVSGTTGAATSPGDRSAD